MTYEAEISRVNPGCFLFVIDQSGSMNDPLGGDVPSGRLKKDEVADVINKTLQEMAIRCAKEEAVRDYFHIGVIGYGGSVGPAFGGTLSTRNMVPISEVADNPLRIDERTKKVSDGAGGLAETTAKFPLWFEPVAANGTPMNQALSLAYTTLSDWLAIHTDSYPPIVIHITDGESTDGDPQAAADRLKTLSTMDGNVLLLNIHVSADNSPKVEFPASDSQLPNEYARLLFNMSSELPEQMLAVAKELGLTLQPGAHGFVFNAGIVELVQFLDIGTRITQSQLR